MNAGTKTTTTKGLKNHPMYATADLNYLRAKGYANDEIKAFWDRDLKLGKEPIHKFAEVMDLVGYLNEK